MPPKPNAQTAATRRAAVHGRAASRKRNGLVAGSHAGFGFLRCKVGGRTPWYSASAHLISPAMPAAHLVWPICDFTEPSTQAPAVAPARPNTSVSVASSVRSPTTVPVPWASTSPTSAGDTPAWR